MSRRRKVGATDGGAEQANQVDVGELFRLALGLPAPWRVARVEFETKAGGTEGVLHLHLDFPAGSRFACPTCAAADLPVYDTGERQWRHMNFFQYECYLHARLPRVSCGQCGVKTVQVPWARPGSGFTLLFEALVLTLAREMPMRAVTQLLNEWDTRLWRIAEHYVNEARSQEDFSAVRRLGVDETAARRGQHYVSLFVDPEQSRVLFACEGRDHTTVERFREDFEAHGGQPEAVAEVTMDMSPAFIKGVEAEFPEATITFDKFHVVKQVNDAVDEVRRGERKQRPELAGTRYLWLRNPKHMTPHARATLANLRHGSLKTARAYAIKEALEGFWTQDEADAETYLRHWYFWATHSRLEPMIRAARTIKQHWDGILSYMRSHATNAILEGINSLVQAARARARGYRSIRNYITMIYLLAAKLDYRLPTLNRGKLVFAHTK